MSQTDLAPFRALLKLKTAHESGEPIDFYSYLKLLLCLPISELLAEVEALRVENDGLTATNERYLLLLERMAVANHMREHAGMHAEDFDQCRDGFCKDFHECGVSI